MDIVDGITKRRDKMTEEERDRIIAQATAERDRTRVVRIFPFCLRGDLQSFRPCNKWCRLTNAGFVNLYLF
jgi:hypothetical protein